MKYLQIMDFGKNLIANPQFVGEASGNIKSILVDKAIRISDAFIEEHLVSSFQENNIEYINEIACYGMENRFRVYGEGNVSKIGFSFSIELRLANVSVIWQKNKKNFCFKFVGPRINPEGTAGELASGIVSKIISTVVKHILPPVVGSIAELGIKKAIQSVIKEEMKATIVSTVDGITFDNDILILDLYKYSPIKNLLEWSFPLKILEKNITFNDLFEINKISIDRHGILFHINPNKKNLDILSSNVIDIGKKTAEKVFDKFLN